MEKTSFVCKDRFSAGSTETEKHQAASTSLKYFWKLASNPANNLREMNVLSAANRLRED